MHKIGLYIFLKQFSSLEGANILQNIWYVISIMKSYKAKDIYCAKDENMHIHVL